MEGKSIPKVATVIVARNEEQVIATTLKSIETQTLLPYRIIVINDGSTDKTAEIVSSFTNVELINRPKREESFVGRKELAETVNVGLKLVHDDQECEFIWISGADSIYPKDYLFKIIEKMKSNSNLVIASGVIKNEFSIEPRGSGRVVRCDFWGHLGMLYPVNYGWEGYLVLKAQSMGYEATGYPDIIFFTQRKTGTRINPKKYYYYGLGLKALGYTFTYTLFKFFLLTKRKPKGAYYMFKGYLSDYDDLYEPELREFVRKTQMKNITRLDLNYITRFFRTLVHAK